MACKTLPPVSFEDCNPNHLHGNIPNIYFTNLGNPLTDVTDATEWGTRQDDTTATDTLIRKLRVRADKPLPTSSLVNRAGYLKSIGPRTHVINFDIDDMSDSNYSAALSVQDGPNWLIWYEDEEGNIYGGNSGIKVAIDLAVQIPREKQDGQTIQGTITWESKKDPERATSPL